MERCTHRNLHLNKTVCDNCMECVVAMDYGGLGVTVRTVGFDGYDEYDELP